MLLNNLNLTKINSRLSREDTDKIHKEIDTLLDEVSPLVSNILYHYTSLDGLLGIIKSSSLWMSHAAYLNDASELNYGTKLISDMINKKIKDKKYNEINDILRVSSIVFSNYYRDSVNPYVLSLSEEIDVLSQWRAYGNNCGVSIGFNPKNILELKVSYLNITNESRLIKVIYEKEEQINLIEKAIDIILKYDHLTEFVAPANLSSAGSSLTEISMNMFMEIIPSFKHPSFHEEKEWRLLKVMSLTHEKEHKVVNHRFRSGVLIPYLELKAQDKLPIIKIRYGPNPNPYLTRKAIESLLIKHGYEVPVDGTDTPLRVL